MWIISWCLFRFQNPFFCSQLSIDILTKLLNYETVLSEAMVITLGHVTFTKKIAKFPGKKTENDFWFQHFWPTWNRSNLIQAHQAKSPGQEWRTWKISVTWAPKAFRFVVVWHDQLRVRWFKVGSLFWYLDIYPILPGFLIHHQP